MEKEVFKVSGFKVAGLGLQTFSLQLSNLEQYLEEW
jgi:hypothetical protein